MCHPELVEGLYTRWSLPSNVVIGGGYDGKSGFFDTFARGSIDFPTSILFVVKVFLVITVVLL